MSEKNDRFLGALLGVAVGDALGAPLEFLSAEEIKKRHGGEVRDMIGGGWLNVVPGEITDDTEMTLAVAEGIVESHFNPIPAIGRRFIAWYDSGPKDMGDCCRAAIAAAKERGAENYRDWYRAAQRVHKEKGGRTAGNGALMRTIFPALWYGAEAPAIAGQIAHMTHIHRHSHLAVTVYTIAVEDIIARREAAPERLRERIRHYMEPVRRLTGGNDPEPDGYAPNSLMCAVNAVTDTSCFEDALIRAVNLGGDADTIGAIAGGLAGALYGAEAVPQRWTDALDPDITRQIEQLAKKAENYAC
ncbi:MAG: ADP-ribosylglycohydrolase family protein [Oscillospiraceae bacterium]|nr:ADP-ribosylglycohydrolase family protein [Oscillospiraceae bacterium]